MKVFRADKGMVTARVCLCVGMGKSQQVTVERATDQQGFVGVNRGKGETVNKLQRREKQ